MAVVAAGVLCAWPSTIATIPTHFTRVAALDGRYCRGAAPGYDPYGSGGPNPGSQGGSATHTHVSLTHGHTAQPHTHSVAGLTPSATGVATIAMTVGSSANVSGEGHSHAATVSTSLAQSVADPGVWSTGPSDPGNYTVIWVQSDGNAAVTGFPANALLYWYQTVLPIGWTQPVASQGLFLKGAAAAANGGTATALAPHSHSDTHTHSSATHTHADTASAPDPSGYITASVVSGGGVYAAVGHSHLMNILAAGGAAAAVPAAVCGAGPAEPPYTTLSVIQNATGGLSFPAYAIALWTGALSAIPAGWSLCNGSNGTPDMRSQFAKTGVNLTDVGTTGGGQSHSHAAPSAAHTHDFTHTHTQFLVGGGIQGTVPGDNSSVTFNIDLSTHGHGYTSTTTGAAGGLSDAQTTQIGDVTGADARPPYTDVAFIMYTAPPVVNVTSPAPSAVESLPSFAVTWSYAVLRIQITYRLFVYAANGVDVVYDSLPQRSSALSATIPAGYLQDNTTYKLQVVISDSGNQSATSGLVQFSTNWSAPPTPGSVTATPIGGS